VDIKGYFDNIDHSVLMKLLERRIDDRKFLLLIRNMLKAGFLEQWKFNETYSGTPQGGIISPLLANIYLHEFDLFMEDFIRNFTKGTKRARNPEHNRLLGKAQTLRKRIEKLRITGREDEAREVLAKHDEYKAKAHTMPSVDPMDPTYKRLRYVRYADDFLLGVIGSKEEARTIMLAVESFLTTTLKLEVSTERSGIRKASKGARFLGYDARTYTGSRQVVQHLKGAHKGIKRSVVERMQLSVPREKVQAFATKNGYGQYEECKAKHRNELLHCDDVELVHIYNAELRGFANYYALAHDVKRKLSKLHLIWQTSLFKSLAAKHKTTLGKMVAQSKISPGNYVVWQVENGKRVEAKIWCLKDLTLKGIVGKSVDNLSQMARMANSVTRYVDRITAQQCVSCGTIEGPFEIHHKNPMRKSKGTALSGRRRQTEVLCTDCHRLLHAGRLPDRREQVDGNGEPDEAKVSSPVRWEGEGWSQ
jgi:RNA-directed DNA polymerase